MSEPIRIRAIAAGGDGVGALPDGRTVFVPRTALGDLIEPRDVTLARRFARARVARVLEASAERVTPRCPHYEGDECGGCQLQHLSPDAQRTARRHVVGDALRRIGHLEVEDPPLEPSEAEWEYRAKISLTAKGSRIGYHRVGRPNEVFDLDRCLIARPELNALWDGIRRHRRLLPECLTQVVLRVDREKSGGRGGRGESGGRGEAGLHAIFRVAGTQAWTRARELGAALAKDGIAAVLWWEPEGGAPRAMFGASEAYPAMVFEQVHPAMGDRVRDHAVATLGEVSGRHIWDLYAGIGEATRALAHRGATVESVESDHRAVAVAEARGPSEGIKRMAARVEDALDHLSRPDGIVVNPPRTGLSESVSRRLSNVPSGRLIYVSCDPATLARDIARLAESYRVADVRAFDLFPQTAHVEAVVRLERP